MQVQAPTTKISDAPGAEFTFRSHGKTISLVHQGQETIVTLTFDNIDATGGARPAGTQPGDASAIALQGDDLWEFLRRAPEPDARLASPPGHVATRVLTDLLR